MLPFLKLQFHNLVEDFPTYFKQLMLTIDAFFRTSFFAPYYEGLDINAKTIVETAPANIGKFFTDTIGGIAVGVTSFVSALTGFILAIVTVPFILFYLLKDGEKLPKFIMKMLPPRMRDDAKIIFRDADNQISSYIQGQILVAMCIGIMVSIGFLHYRDGLCAATWCSCNVYECCSLSWATNCNYACGDYCDCFISVDAY